jgi:hypothetical protein
LYDTNILSPEQFSFFRKKWLVVWLHFPHKIYVFLLCKYYIVSITNATFPPNIIVPLNMNIDGASASESGNVCISDLNKRKSSVDLADECRDGKLAKTMTPYEEYYKRKKAFQNEKNFLARSLFVELKTILKMKMMNQNRRMMKKLRRPSTQKKT